MDITSELIVGAAGVVLSLVFSYIPGLRTWYAGLKDEIKRLIMLGLLLLTAGAIFGLICYGLIVSGNIACDKNGIIGLVKLFVLALIANQSTYLITPTATDVRAIKSEARAAEIKSIATRKG